MAAQALRLYIRRNLDVSQTSAEVFAQQLWHKMKRMKRRRLAILKNLTLNTLDAVISIVGETTEHSSRCARHALVIRNIMVIYPA